MTKFLLCYDTGSRRQWKKALGIKRLGYQALQTSESPSSVGVHASHHGCSDSWMEAQCRLGFINMSVKQSFLSEHNCHLKGVAPEFIRHEAGHDCACLLSQQKQTKINGRYWGEGPLLWGDTLLCILCFGALLPRKQSFKLHRTHFLRSPSNPWNHPDHGSICQMGGWALGLDNNAQFSYLTKWWHHNHKKHPISFEVKLFFCSKGSLLIKKKKENKWVLGSSMEPVSARDSW